MEVQEHYDGWVERTGKINLREGQGLRMLTDHFDVGWKVGEEPRGTMVFTDIVVPETAEQIAEGEARTLMDAAIAFIDSISTLADVKAFLKKLCARLIKRGILP